MLYFDLAIYKEDLLTDKELEMPKIAQDAICNFRKFFGQPLKQNVLGKQLVILPKVNKRVLKKIDKILKINVERNICISEELRLKEEFVDFINSQNINILDGRWLFKYMIEDVLDFICKHLALQPQSQEISILTNENDNFIFETIMKISQKVKNINIITKNPNIFKKLVDKVYEENGLIIRATSDFRKSALKSHIILNLNFDENEIKKINFDKDITLVNFDKSLNIDRKNFTGRVVNFYHINLPKKYTQGYERFKNFNSSILYESFIYKKTLTKNIWKEIKDDKIKIDSLEGKNKTIRFSKNDKILENVKVQDA